jgi:hypothetical protein
MRYGATHTVAVFAAGRGAALQWAELMARATGYWPQQTTMNLQQCKSG